MKVKETLPELRSGLIEFLRSKKYKEACIRKFNQSWDHLEKYMHQRGISKYSRDVGEAFIKEHFNGVPYCNLKKFQKNRVRHIEVLADFQETGSILWHRLKVPPIIFPGTLGSTFNGFIAHAKALKRSEKSIQQYKQRLRTLYIDLQQSGKCIQDINAPYIIKYLAHLDQTIPGEVNKSNIIMTIRVFLRYLCEEKLLENNHEEYWMTILPTRVVRQAKIPSVYSREEVERLIAAIDRSNPQGKRDYAMILLAARYGLRVSDITGLRYCNLDWAANRIVLLQQKTDKKIELPLSEEVGKAIIDYLKFARPDINEPYVFIKASAPYGKLTNASITRAISNYMRLADISFEERKHGPHALRHSLATNLLGLNEPLPVISEILGHSSTESTSSYLKVNFSQLKQCALEVPCVPSSFYQNLYSHE